MPKYPLKLLRHCNKNKKSKKQTQKTACGQLAVECNMTKMFLAIYCFGILHIQNSFFGVSGLKKALRCWELLHAIYFLLYLNQEQNFFLAIGLKQRCWVEIVCVFVYAQNNGKIGAEKNLFLCKGVEFNDGISPSAIFRSIIFQPNMNWRNFVARQKIHAIGCVIALAEC